MAERILDDRMIISDEVMNMTPEEIRRELALYEEEMRQKKARLAEGKPQTA